MSCSYGLDRYDINYEEEGNDYPYGHVRWTEQRNMQAFLQLLSENKVSVKHLITHTFDIAEAEAAYDIVMGKVKVPHIGILLSYFPNKHKFDSAFNLNLNPLQQINAGFVGAGSFAQSYLIPNVKKT